MRVKLGKYANAAYVKLEKSENRIKHTIWIKKIYVLVQNRAATEKA
jgi:hypothetical protein